MLRIFPLRTPYSYSGTRYNKCVILCQKELNLLDEELKVTMLERMNCLSALLHLFTPEECVDIVLMESSEDTEALTKIYAKAKQRFRQRFPCIKC